MNETEECLDVEMPLVGDVNNCDSIQTNVITDTPNDVQVAEVAAPQNRYENRFGTFTTDIDIFSPEEKTKMEERAKRFGLLDKVKSPISNQEQDLYSSMGIDEENDNTKYTRLNVIHMRGTEDMSTKDVFKYFEDYAPASIEWINDVSCNVVWLDNMSAARAMLWLSKKIVGICDKVQNLNQSKENENNCHSSSIESIGNSKTKDQIENTSVEEVLHREQEDCIHIKDIKCPLPPGIWRKGVDYPKSKGIFLRFATRADKKQANAEKMSEYYKKYGNPNFGGVKGILTESRKRMYRQVRQTKRKRSDSDSAEEGDAKRVKNPWGDLSENWGLDDFTEDCFTPRSDSKDRGSSIKERLGSKQRIKDDKHMDNVDESDSEDDWCKRSKILRMRMHADDEEEKMHKRRVKLQQQTSMENPNQSGDLRARLGKQKKQALFRDAIQVVVTNTNADNMTSIKMESESEEEDGEIVEDNEDDVGDEEEEDWKENIDEDCEIADDREEGEEESNDDSDDPAKEIQGPRGSVVKVVQHKPRVASTVWARLKTPLKSEINDSLFKERSPITRVSHDLRRTLKGVDLRSRIGRHTRGRSPLRIEVKNDKYTEEHNIDD